MQFHQLSIINFFTDQFILLIILEGIKLNPELTSFSQFCIFNTADCSYVKSPPFLVGVSMYKTLTTGCLFSLVHMHLHFLQHFSTFQGPIKMAEGGFDPCECVCSHEYAMRRLLNLVRYGTQGLKLVN